jgi:phosphoribosyl 1,2-cyclic phosphodiesterase
MAAMRTAPVFRITYWGVTGTLSAPLRPAEVTDRVVQAIRYLAERGQLADLGPGPDLEARVRQRVEQELPFHQRSSYGGNTTCVEVETPDALIILDCGSGFRELGAALERRWMTAGVQRRAHVLVTHPHMDHTFATPYFAPYYNPTCSFTIHASQKTLDSLAVLLNPDSALSQLYFPPTYAEMKALENFRVLTPGMTFSIGSTEVRTQALNHPGDCLGFRLENAGRVFVFATDHEQVQVPDMALAELARDADLLYADGQYTAAEYDGQVGIAGDVPLCRRGWGHSSIEACVTTAVAAGVRRLHVGHRDPRRIDEQIAQMEAALQELLHRELDRVGRPEDACQVCIPHEGLTLFL